MCSASISTKQLNCKLTGRLIFILKKQHYFAFSSEIQIYVNHACNNLLLVMFMWKSRSVQTPKKAKKLVTRQRVWMYSHSDSIRKELRCGTNLWRIWNSPSLQMLLKYQVDKISCWVHFLLQIFSSMSTRVGLDPRRELDLLDCALKTLSKRITLLNGLP